MPRSSRIQVGDVCLIKYNSENNVIYRLCVISKVFPDDCGVVHNVEVGYSPRQLCSPDRAYNPSALDVVLMDVKRLVLICPAGELPDKASGKVPDPKNKQSGEHGYSDEASQENLAKDYTEDYAKVSCGKASKAAVSMASVFGESIKSAESAVAAELTKSSETENMATDDESAEELPAEEVPIKNKPTEYESTEDETVKLPTEVPATKDPAKAPTEVPLAKVPAADVSGAEVPPA